MPRQTSEESIYSIVEIIQGQLSAKKGSELSRELMAYTYYALIHQKADLKPEDRANRVTQFIARLAEIRRANNRTLTSIDISSCIVGIYSRAAKLWDMEDELRESLSINESCKRVLVPKVLSAFKKALNNCTNEDEKTSLFKALTDLNSKTAADYFEKPKDNPTKEEQNKQQEKLAEQQKLAIIRQQFVLSLGNSKDIFKEINNELMQKKIKPLKENQIIFPIAMLEDIGGGWISMDLTEEYRLQVPVVEEVLPTISNAPVNPFELKPELAARFPQSIVQKRQQKASLWAIVYPLLDENQKGELAEAMVNNVFDLRSDHSIDAIIQRTCVEQQELLEEQVKATLKNALEQFFISDIATNNAVVLDNAVGAPQPRYITRYQLQHQNHTRLQDQNQMQQSSVRARR